MDQNNLKMKKKVMLVRKFNPDYLLLHPMGMDYVGETYGADSSEYRNQTIQQDKWMTTIIAEWIKMGYNNLVTGEVISQLQIAPTICKLLGLTIPGTMKYPSIV